MPDPQGSLAALTARHGARIAIAHIDDVGMCHGANRAFAELSRESFVTCGSVMVPCPWFLEAAAQAAEDPALDLGVHLTLNSEKRHYRWRPLTGATASSGLVDDSGHMWPSVRALGRNFVLEAAEAELRAQIDAALAAGIDVSHLDAHMGAMMLPGLRDLYLALGRDYRLPVMLPRSLEHYDIKHHLDDPEEAAYQVTAAAAEAAGHVLFDRVIETPWWRKGEAREVYAGLFRGLPDGLSFLAFHCNAPGEVEVIEPESADIRIAENRLFGDPSFIAEVEALGIAFIGFREIRELFRSRSREA